MGEREREKEREAMPHLSTFRTLAAAYIGLTHSAPAMRVGRVESESERRKHQSGTAGSAPALPAPAPAEWEVVGSSGGK